jgi:hypothetical protein
LDRTLRWDVDRRTLTVLAVAVVAILAISIAAATLSSTVESEGSESDQQRPGGDERFGLNETETQEDDGPDLPELPAVVEQLLIAVLLGSVVASVVYLIRSPRETVAMIAIVVAVGVLFWLFLQVFSGLNLFEHSGDLLPPGGDGEGDGLGNPEGAAEPAGPLAVTLVVVLGVVLVGVVLLLRRDDADTDDELAEREAVETGETDDTQAIGAIAGQAADRIEAGAADDREAANEVYRAWQEMTTQLDIEAGETTTPREFQQEAVAAGMAAGDIRELTGLFETVRYGGESATEDRERRAVAVLRRIESAYGDGE